MLRQPLNGFAKRVDDTVVRAMNVLHNKEDYTAKPVDRALLRPAPRPMRQSPADHE
jgi:hypothetical protein